MIVIDRGSDFEMYSSTSKGAIQANGYIFHAGKSCNFTSTTNSNLSSDKKYGPRILRLNSVKNLSIHDVALVDGKYPGPLFPKPT